ncbi:inhibitor of apoptosis-promoting Bax1-domain-containing protein [Gigaspora rosea]|uniref:Inhibitor of apoptosis-promoting Bax1-domain-containing protein n=1 Tax=Gigaspora rosea TaxID=44941 RepID=A0A397UGP8_9GLOM|nr:inhibitor of apoptosis-promoting Bax1-domain-containing protein [Gigaspora rosea]
MQQQTYNGLQSTYTESCAERKTSDGWEYNSHIHSGYNVKVSECDLKVRMEFVRKVYSILFAQISLSASVAALMMYNSSIKYWVQSHGWVIYIVSILTFGLLFALQTNHRSYPDNYFLLAAFTLAESYTIGTVVTYYNYFVVLRSLIVTSGLFIGIVLYTMQSKYDFTGLFPLLYNGLLFVLEMSIIRIFMPFGGALDFIFTLITIALFCGFVAFDTFAIMTTKHPEEYILAAVELYLDFINIFLRILEFLNKSQSRRD